MSINKTEPNLNTNNNKPRKNNLNRIIGNLVYVIGATIHESYNHPKEPSKLFRNSIDKSPANTEIETVKQVSNGHNR